MTDSDSPDTTDKATRRTLAGDWEDDDGQAIDDTLLPAFNGPVSSESIAYEKQDIPKATRILSRAITIGLVGGIISDPVQVFPTDLNRKSVQVQTTAAVVIGSEKTDIYNGAPLASTTLWTSHCHTGAVWIYAPDAVGTVVVTVWCVTS